MPVRTHWTEEPGNEHLTRQPSELDLCPECAGKANPDCRVHGIAASNARQSVFYRTWNEKHGD